MKFPVVRREHPIGLVDQHVNTEMLEYQVLVPGVMALVMQLGVPASDAPVIANRCIYEFITFMRDEEPVEGAEFGWTAEYWMHTVKRHAENYTSQEVAALGTYRTRGQGLAHKRK